MKRQFHPLVVLAFCCLCIVKGGLSFPLTPTTVTHISPSGASASSQKTTSSIPTSLRTTTKMTSSVPSSTFSNFGMSSVPFTPTVKTASPSTTTRKTSFATSTLTAKTFSTSNALTFSTSSRTSFSSSAPRTSIFTTSMPITSIFATLTPKTITVSTSTPSASTFSTSTYRTQTFNTPTAGTSISTPNTFSTPKPSTSTFATSSVSKLTTRETFSTSTSGTSFSTTAPNASFSTTSKTSTLSLSTPKSEFFTSSAQKKLSATNAAWTATNESPEASSSSSILDIATTSRQSGVSKDSHERLNETPTNLAPLTKLGSDWASVQTGMTTRGQEVSTTAGTNYYLSTITNTFDWSYLRGRPIFSLTPPADANVPKELPGNSSEIKPATVRPTGGAATITAFSALKSTPASLSTPTPETATWASASSLSSMADLTTTSSFQTARTSLGHGGSTDVGTNHQANTTRKNYVLLPPIQAISLIFPGSLLHENLSSPVTSSTSVKSTTAIASSLRISSLDNDYGKNSKIYDTMNTVTTLKSADKNVTSLNGAADILITSNEAIETLKALNETTGQPMMENGTMGSSKATNETSDPSKTLTESTSTFQPLVLSTTAHMNSVTYLPTTLKFVGTTKKPIAQAFTRIALDLLYRRISPNTNELKDPPTTNITNILSDLVASSPAAPSVTKSLNTILSHTSEKVTTDTFEDTHRMLNNVTKPILQTSLPEIEISTLQTEEMKELTVQSLSGLLPLFEIAKPTDPQETSSTNQEVKIFPVVTKPKIEEDPDSSQTSISLGPWILETVSKTSDPSITSLEPQITESDSTTKVSTINSSIAVDSNNLLKSITSRYVEKTTGKMLPVTTTDTTQQSNETIFSSIQSVADETALVVKQTVGSPTLTTHRITYTTSVNKTPSTTSSTKITSTTSSTKTPTTGPTKTTTTSEDPTEDYFYDASRGAQVGGTGLVILISSFLFVGATHF